MRLIFLLFSVFFFTKPLAAQDCHIFDLTATVVDCANGQFYVVLDFQYDNTSNEGFKVLGNGQNYGSFPYSQVPVTIGPLPANGTTDYEFAVKDIVFQDCQDVVEVGPVNCGSNTDCEIFDLAVDLGDCNNDGTYQAWVNFQVQNPGNDFFDLWANGQFLGNFPLGDLPLSIPNFPADNNGPNDYVKVCINDNPDCCKILEFAAPDCPGNDNCDIYDLVVETGDCNTDGTFHAWVNFQVQNPGSDSYDIWADGQYLGHFALADLPLHIEHFPNGNSTGHYVKVCINDNPDCCEIKQFIGPQCDGNDNCEIHDLVVETGDCNNDGTYHAWINFQVQNPGSDLFGVWANGQYLGHFPLADLPLHIEHFPADNNGPNDVVKVCVGGPNSNPICCKVLEFPAPNCPGQNTCEIFDIVVETGDCNDDGTYHLWLNFQVDNPTDDQFDLWANSGTFLGTFNLADLPLHIEHFPTDGGATDRVKICINDDPGCCKTKNFVPPVCPSEEECRIWKLKVTHTPCVCGQYFALLTFRYKNTGANGFDVTGNGQNYGNFPYSTTQPIVIGPLAGDGTTDYAFVVTDHDNPDCYDEVQLGTVDCDDDKPEVKLPESASLNLSPNPASDRVLVGVQSAAGRVGPATVQVFRADGRLLRTVTVADGSVFTLEVADLPPGVYRVRVVGESGAFAGDFVKQ